jgi:hypothetical protein
MAADYDPLKQHDNMIRGYDDLIHAYDETIDGIDLFIITAVMVVGVATLVAVCLLLWKVVS